MRHCGNCGNSLDFGSLASGRCPTCGATIGPFGDLVAPATVVKPAAGFSVDQDALDPERPEGLVPPPLPPRWPAGLPAPRQRRAPAAIALVALIAAVALVLSGILTLSLHDWGGSGHGGSPSHGTGGDVGIGAQAQASSFATSHAGQPTVQPSASADATVPAGVTVTVYPGTIVPGGPVLTVGPVTCGVGTIGLTIQNSGGGTLNWSATVMLIEPVHYSGSLPAGQQQTVTVGTRLLQVPVTVSAPDAANSPQSLTIKCPLL